MSWLLDNPALFWLLFLEHVWLSVIPVGVAIVLAIPIGMLTARRRTVRKTAAVIASILFTVPSLALFVVLPLIIGTSILDPLNVVVALSLYSTALLVRVVPEALDAIPPDVADAATAVGFSSFRRSLSVDLPLAAPVLIANLRVITVTNVSMVSVAAVIGLGGLGRLFTAGFNRNYPDQIFAGIIGVFVLALVLDFGLLLIGYLATPWTRTGKVSRAQKRRARAEVAELDAETNVPSANISDDEFAAPVTAGGR